MRRRRHVEVLRRKGRPVQARVVYPIKTRQRRQRHIHGVLRAIDALATKRVMRLGVVAIVSTRFQQEKAGGHESKVDKGWLGELREHRMANLILRAHGRVQSAAHRTRHVFRVQDATVRAAGADTGYPAHFCTTRIPCQRGYTRLRHSHTSVVHIGSRARNQDKILSLCGFVAVFKNK